MPQGICRALVREKKIARKRSNAFTKSLKRKLGMLCLERAVKMGHLALSTAVLGGITIQARTALPLG